eukprot:TRINITY_DN3123_c0_g1_i11.p1 TRINITY_DN3123_c0_g1~~TRINITY_DN3123_c0_g1_i11.p1  ORF type:complete len:247 (-),score=35.17 TRINITY_DN3123_c0_g1_i11:232-972(-)
MNAFLRDREEASRNNKLSDLKAREQCWVPFLSLFSSSLRHLSQTSGTFIRYTFDDSFFEKNKDSNEIVHLYSPILVQCGRGQEFLERKNRFEEHTIEFKCLTAFNVASYSWMELKQNVIIPYGTKFVISKKTRISPKKTKMFLSQVLFDPASPFWRTLLTKADLQLVDLSKPGIAEFVTRLTLSPTQTYKEELLNDARTGLRFRGPALDEALLTQNLNCSDELVAMLKSGTKELEAIEKSNPGRIP